MECHACGRQIPDDSRFCAHCGRRLSDIWSCSEEREAPVLPKPSVDGVRRLQGYELGEPLVVGSCVYEGRKEGGEHVAIKILSWMGGITPALRQRALAGLEHVIALRHPHLVTCYRVLHEEGCYGLAMELLEGEPLEKRLRHGRLPVDEALDLAQDLLSALEAAHKARIFHHDLKPSNIFLATPTPPTRAVESWFGDEPLLGEEGPYRPVILNMGLARQRLLSGNTATVDQNGDPGAVPYLSPEQIRRNALLDQRSDLYSLGVVLFEILTGERLVQGDTPFTMVNQILRDSALPLPREVVEQLPAGVERWLRRLLAKKPDDRPPNAIKALQELKQLRRRGGQARPRWRWGLLLGLILILSIGAVVLVDLPGDLSSWREWWPQGTQTDGGLSAPTERKNPEQPPKRPVPYVEPESDAPPDDLKKMVRVPMGWFGYGGVGSGHRLKMKNLPVFWIDRYEVTNQQYKKCVQAGRCTSFPFAQDRRYNKPRQPVVGVHWAAAAAYCRFRRKRLPSALEWEKAARGPEAQIHAFRGEINCRKANYGHPLQGKAECPNNPGAPSPVGTYPLDRSPYGVFDLSGNVHEWVLDCPSRRGGRCTHREARGGAWNVPSSALLAARHLRFRPSHQAANLGFRCVWPR